MSLKHIDDEELDHLLCKLVHGLRKIAELTFLNLCLHVLILREMLSETDTGHRESYKHQLTFNLMVKRSPGHTMTLGIHNGEISVNQLSFSNILRCVELPDTPKKLNKGVKKQEEIKVTQNQSQGISVNFRVSDLMSSPKEISQQEQRQEWNCEVIQEIFNKVFNCGLILNTDIVTFAVMYWKLFLYNKTIVNVRAVVLKLALYVNKSLNVNKTILYSTL